MESTLNAEGAAPSPALFLETAQAHERSAALHAAVDLGVFTAIGATGATSPEIARTCEASERGIRILCDYLTIIGFLAKTEKTYALTPDSAMFLDKSSQAYLGDTLTFLHRNLRQVFGDMTEAVRKGGTTLPGNGSVENNHPMWVDFAKAMMSTMMPQAMGVAKCLQIEPGQKCRVLDIAAGHGLCGIVIAQHHPGAEITALDWGPVLEVAQRNAERFGVADRFHRMPGSAFDLEFGEGYDVILLTNFLHHFDEPTCVSLLKKVRAALAPGGQVVTVDFLVNEDRISPPFAAAFSLTMLTTTPSGDAYTYRQYESMFREAGYSKVTFLPLPPSPEGAIISIP